jgi:hypothetical protein
MITLKEALEKGKIKGFIKEHDKDPKGDLKKVDSTILRWLLKRSQKLLKHHIRTIVRIKPIFKFTRKSKKMYLLNK